MNKKPERRNFKKGPPRDGPPKGSRPSGAQARGPAPSPAGQQGPPDNTLREANYLRSLVVNNTPVRIRLRDNEEVEGVVEYYDANFVRLTRAGEANLFIYKGDIKYLEEQT